MDLALIIDDTINQYKHKTPMPLKSKFKKIFDDAWGKAHLMQMEDLPAEEKYAFSLFYKKANDTMTDEEKEWFGIEEDSPIANTKFENPMYNKGYDDGFADGANSIEEDE